MDGRKKKFRSVGAESESERAAHPCTAASHSAQSRGRDVAKLECNDTAATVHLGVGPAWRWSAARVWGIMVNGCCCRSPRLTMSGTARLP